VRLIKPWPNGVASQCKFGNADMRRQTCDRWADGSQVNASQTQVAKKKKHISVQTCARSYQGKQYRAHASLGQTESQVIASFIQGAPSYGSGMSWREELHARVSRLPHSLSHACVVAPTFPNLQEVGFYMRETSNQLRIT